MKKWKIILFLMIFVLGCTACGGKKEGSEEKSEEKTQETTNIKSDMIYDISMEDGSKTIVVSISEEFEETEYSSDEWLTLQSSDGDDESSVQLNLHLEAGDVASVEEAMIDEVTYLLSANSDGKESMEVEEISANSGTWFYFSYNLDGLEGYKIWTKLEEGTVLVGTLEYLGEEAGSGDIEEFIGQKLTIVQN